MMVQARERLHRRSVLRILGSPVPIYDRNMSTNRKDLFFQQRFRTMGIPFGIDPTDHCTIVATTMLIFVIKKAKQNESE